MMMSYGLLVSSCRVLGDTSKGLNWSRQHTTGGFSRKRITDIPPFAYMPASESMEDSMPILLNESYGS